MRTDRIVRRIVRGLTIALMAAAAFVLFTFFVMWLWNWLTPDLFGWHRITFWQALGLLVLSKILFGGFRGGWGHRGRWSRRMQERWEQMTPEEREKFRKGMQSWCSRRGTSPSASASGTSQAPGA